jgi:hypothetical protein
MMPGDFNHLGVLDAKNDNIYPVEMHITAKANPALELVIHQYIYRIYYCAVAGDPTHKHFAYFENELIPPIGQTPG